MVGRGRTVAIVILCVETSMVTVALKLEIRKAYSVPMSAMVAMFASVPGAAWCSLDLSLPGAGCAAALGFACARRYWTFSCQKILDFLVPEDNGLFMAPSTSPPPPLPPLLSLSPPNGDCAIPRFTGRSRVARLQPTGPSTLERSPAFTGGYKNYGMYC